MEGNNCKAPKFAETNSERESESDARVPLMDRSGEILERIAYLLGGRQVSHTIVCHSKRGLEELCEHRGKSSAWCCLSVLLLPSVAGSQVASNALSQNTETGLLGLAESSVGVMVQELGICDSRVLFRFPRQVEDTHRECGIAGPMAARSRLAADLAVGSRVTVTGKKGVVSGLFTPHTIRVLFRKHFISFPTVKSRKYSSSRHVCSHRLY